MGILLVSRATPCVIGDRAGDMVGDICLARPLRCSAPGERVRGLMGAGRRRGELLITPGGGLDTDASRRDEWMEGLLRDECSWELWREAWMEGLLREEERPWVVPIPRCIMAAGRLPVLLPPLRLGYPPPSSGSRGVGRGEGKCRLLRSGREPPVFRELW